MMGMSEADELPTELCDIDPDSNFFNSLFPSLDSDTQSAYYSVQSYNESFNSSNRILSIINCNVRSYHANGDNLLALCGSLVIPPNIVVVTETWFRADTVQCPNNYCGFHTVRNVGRSGGVSVFVDSCLVSVKIDSLCYSTNIVESCVVDIRCDNSSYVIN